LPPPERCCKERSPPSAIVSRGACGATRELSNNPGRLLASRSCKTIGLLRRHGGRPSGWIRRTDFLDAAATPCGAEIADTRGPRHETRVASRDT
jgi:hypothetical protein